MGQRVVEMGGSGAREDGSPESAQGDEGEREWSGGESNSRHLACKASALPTELPPRLRRVCPSCKLHRDAAGMCDRSLAPVGCQGQRGWGLMGKLGGLKDVPASENVMDSPERETLWTSREITPTQTILRSRPYQSA